jgi:hypothetical protein
MHDRDLLAIWTVFAAHDGGSWKYQAYGELDLELEETQKYQAKRIQDRFTPEMLGRYLKLLGIDVFSPEFYDSAQPAWQVYKEGAINPRVNGYTLIEARANF